MAGCQSLNSGSDDQAAAETGNPWLVSPDTLGRNHYAFSTIQPSTIMEHKSALAEEMRSNFETQMQLDGVDTVGSLDALHRIANAILVLAGPFDRYPLTSQLSEAGFEETGSHGEYTLYSSGTSQTFAVSDSRFVQASTRNTDIEVDAETAVTSTLDAYSGAGDRYQNVNDDCAQLQSALGAGDIVIGRTNKSTQSVESAVAEGARWRVEGDQTDIATTIVYPEADVADESAVQSWASEGKPFGETTPSVAADGRTVTASAKVPTSDVVGFDVGWKVTGGRQTSPTASFEWSYDPQTGTMTLTHDGGDSIEASKLAVEGDGFADREGADQTSAGTWQGSTTEDGLVAAGNQVVVGVTSDYVLELVFHGDQTVTLARAEGPDA